ncbi:hypothetical protein ACFRCG_41640 [Embleya sp. NPDC056575]|uniref:hypothetical protein n=1 Tax=unclassified Embleya TaxID=2699296 RepID=UPI003692ED64
MTTLIVLAAIAAGAVTIAATALVLFLREARRRAEQYVPTDPAWVAAWLRANNAFTEAVVAEMAIIDHRASIDAWTGEL